MPRARALSALLLLPLTACAAIELGRTDTKGGGRGESVDEGGWGDDGSGSGSGSGGDDLDGFELQPLGDGRGLYRYYDFDHELIEAEGFDPSDDYDCEIEFEMVSQRDPIGMPGGCQTCTHASTMRFGSAVGNCDLGAGPGNYADGLNGAEWEFALDANAEALYLYGRWEEEGYSWWDAADLGYDVDFSDGVVTAYIEWTPEGYGADDWYEFSY
jgi:hypothetical protein